MLHFVVCLNQSSPQTLAGLKFSILTIDKMGKLFVFIISACITALHHCK